MGVAMKTHDCGTLRPKDAGTAVKLAGWVQRRRDHGGLIFVDLRDRSGVVQVVVNPERVGPEVFARAERLRSEYVIMVEGEVVRRMPGMENPALATGEIEVVATALEILNEAATPRFPSTARWTSRKTSDCATVTWTCAGRISSATWRSATG